jgi:serine/threonine protein kinase
MVAARIEGKRLNPEHLDRIETLYNEALALPIAERKAFVDRACGNESALRDELTSLLGYEQTAQTYLETPAMNVIAETLAERGGEVFIDRRLGRYQLLSLVGRGGMGEVYCAVDTRLNRLVAIKLLPPYLAADPERLRRFEEEARAVAALNHPHICTLHDIGNDDRIHYLVFEYLAGELLSERLSRGPIPLQEALTHARDIADALVHAHEHGILHLDLKPQNIMLTRTGAKLFDFGIAELRDGSTAAAGEVKQGDSGERRVARGGTPGYLAPEQLDGDSIDERADVFGFGAVLDELLISASMATEPKLASLVARCLATQPSERCASMAEVSKCLAQIIVPAGSL